MPRSKHLRSASETYSRLYQQPLSTRSLDEVRQLLKAPIGTPITLRLRHPLEPESYEVRLSLSSSKHSSVPQYQLLGWDRDRLSTFQQVCAKR